MNKIYQLMIALHFIIIVPQLLSAKDIMQDNCSCAKNTEQSFIAKNGDVGIYQPKNNTAFIGNAQFIKIKKILINDSKKRKKPSKSILLGKLIDGENIYELYGKEENPAPVNNNPDADVRTEMKINEDFMRNFGSGKYTPDDKWD